MKLTLQHSVKRTNYVNSSNGSRGRQYSQVDVRLDAQLPPPIACAEQRAVAVRAKHTAALCSRARPFRQRAPVARGSRS